MKSNRATKLGLLAVSLTACASMGKPPQGAEARLSTDENAALARIRQKVDGAIVWSSSRLGNHDIFLMKTDGTGVKALTSGEQVDWYPRFSPDGKQILFVRSKKSKTWVKIGEGCQINWFPQGDRILWVNPSGNGDSEVLAEPVKNGAPAGDFSLEQTRFIDIPGRRSHEYFPQLDRSGKWLVWAATQRGHDHDIADYEIYIWEVGAPADQATRLTFHSANDRWPDIYIP